MEPLVRYWFTFEGGSLLRNVGVTAYNIDDARTLASEIAFGDLHLSNEICVVENIDVSTLDENHILPNIGSPTFRGVWYPNFNSH